MSHGLGGWLCGILAALLLVAAGLAGMLAWLERPLYDLRCRLVPEAPAGEHVVHVDIDDASMLHSEKKDLSRADMAAVVDELTRAGASVIVFDMLFEQPSAPTFALGRDGRPRMERGRPVPVDEDDLFAQAVARSGRVVLGAVAERPPEWSAEEREVLALLLLDPTLSPLQLQRRYPVHALDRLGLLTRTALARRLEQARAADPALTREQAAEKILGGNPLAARRLERLLETLWSEHDAARSLAARWPKAPAGAAALPPAELQLPLPAFMRAAAGVGGVNRSLDPDGRLRAVPMGVPVREGFLPPLSLVAACRHLGVDLRDLAQEDGFWTLPGPAAIRVPVGVPRAGEGGGGGVPRLWLRWPSSGEWSEWNSAGHLPVGPLWEIPWLEGEVNRLEREGDEKLIALAALMPRVPLEKINDLRASLDYLAEVPEAASDPAFIEARAARRAALIEAVGPRAGEQKGHGEAWRLLRDRTAAARKTVADARAHFAEKCRGRVCVVGWTATGALADAMAVPVAPICPGACVHGVAIENLLSGRLMRREPLWIDLLVTVVFAYLCIVLACRLPLPWAPGALLLAAGVFIAANGAVFAAGYWQSLAWPLVAGGGAFIAAWVARATHEFRQRRRITAQFRNYVSPSLVDHLVSHPELASLKAERRTLTCVFTDLAGFTSVGERLGAEETARLLNAYLGAATQAFIAAGGNVNKFMGDGMLVFWGAPLEDPQHAAGACRGLLACRAALEKLADDPALAGLPRLALRAGCVTAEVMVGDFGAPPRRSDYTVIGDGVNLAARLESANKQLGTATLVGEATAKAVAGAFLLRPIARLRVVGRSEPEAVFELLAAEADAGERQRRQAQMAAAVAGAFAAADFAACLRAITEAETLDPGAPWLALHRAACERHLAEPGLAFDGVLELERK